MNAEIVNAFVVSILDVLQTMAGLEPRRGEARLKGADERCYDVSAVVGVTGQVQGFVALSFSVAAALHVVGCFLGEAMGRVDEQVKDAVGELANMLAGGAKKALASTGREMRISIPSVIVGPSHRIARPRGTPCLEVPFETEAGPFSVELCLSSDP